MSVRDLIPWGRDNGNRVPTLYRDQHNPVFSLHRGVNRLFDDMFRSFDSLGSLPTFNGGWPKVEISETAGDIKVTAEIPGIEEKDLEILLDGDILTLRGEKRAESEDKERQFSERYFGRFERRIALGYEVEQDKIEARFKNGVLTVVSGQAHRAQALADRARAWRRAFGGATSCRRVKDEWLAQKGTARRLGPF